jgi:hypothetical protein
LALVAVLAWLLTRWFRPVELPGTEHKKKFLFLSGWSTSIIPWLFALCCLASTSIFWAQDWRVSLYLSLHLWLGFGLILSLRDWTDVWRAAAIGFCFALGIQVVTGTAEFAYQSTRFLGPIRLNWPGGLDPSMLGASVVQLADGSRWLRAYGTLPHPNILGAFIIVLLAGPAVLFTLKPRARVWAMLLFFSGVVLLILSFSRAAWVGFFASILVIFVKSRALERKRLLRLGTAGAVSLLVVLLPLQPLIFARTAGTASVPTETFSVIAREWLAGQAVGVIRQYPLLGIGIGSFILNLAQHALPGYIIEPVHNLPLLVTSELGLGGAVILAGMAVVITRRIWKARSLNAVLLSAVLVGLAATSLFDHSLWTMAPGRILLALVLGLWAGQVEHEDR